MDGLRLPQWLIITKKVGTQIFNGKRDFYGTEIEIWAGSEPVGSTKAELLQLNRTQFPSLGIFVSKKVGNRKN